jgi:GT2 family glycosyltransferase
VIHVSSGDFKPKVSEHEKIRALRKYTHSDKRLHFPEAIHWAYEASDKNSECILLLNDDVIMDKDCLDVLYKDTVNRPFIMNPRSNCDDNGRFYWTHTPFDKVQYRIDDMERLCDQVISGVDKYPPMLVKQPQVHFYCTMMTRKCWDDVGGIDTNLKTGFDDADFCLRAKAKGYVPVVAMHAYALHGSGVSADIHLTPEDRAFNEKYFMEKHST